MLSKGYHGLSHSCAYDRVSNDDVLGFEDIDDNSNIHDARAVEVESSAVQTNSNEGADKESPWSNGSSQQAA